MFLLDTNVYVAAANHPPSRVHLETFLRVCGPVAVSAVVLAEILLGLPEAFHQQAADAITSGTPALAPAGEDWQQAALAVRRLERGEVKSRSFWNDALLAAQCARLGVTLITSNQRDFRRLRRAIGFDFAAPFPDRNPFL